MTQVAEHPSISDFKSQSSDLKRVAIAPGVFIDVPAAPWNKRDVAAWQWPPKMSAAAWAEKYRWLTKTAIPGPFRFRNAPYLRGIVHVGSVPGVEVLACQKAVQLGVSEAARALLGYWAHLDPEPTGLLLPNKEKGEQIVDKDVRPLFEREFKRHAELAGLLPSRAHDIKNSLISLANGFILYLMWSGSPASMASNPMKKVIADECNKFAPWTGEDADPISLVEKRMRTYADRLLMLISSPTGADGQITTHFNGCHLQLYYLVACPLCQKRQRLIFGEGGDFGVKFSDACRQLRQAGKLAEASALALQPHQVWYQCIHCHGRIEEREKREAVRSGSWGTVGEDLVRPDTELSQAELGNQWNDGPVADVEQIHHFPAGTRVGMQIGSQNCVWESWTLAHIASEFLGAGTFPQRFAFRTSTLGEAWAQAVEKVSIEALDARHAEAQALGLAEGVAPAWTARLIATVDTQQDHFWMVIRAWGPGMRSQRVWHGRVDHFADIERLCWQTPWKVADTPGGLKLPARLVDKVGIDTGGTRRWDKEKQAGGGNGGESALLPSRVMEIYAWVLAHEAAVNALKGDSRPEQGTYIRRGRGEYVTDGKGGAGSAAGEEGHGRPVTLWLLDTQHFNDELAELMRGRVAIINHVTGEITGEVTRDGETQSGGQAKWALNAHADDEYARHLAALHKESFRHKGKIVQQWRPKREGMRHDYRDAEVYQLALAYQTGVHLLPDEAAYLASVEAEVRRRQAPPLPPAEPRYTTPDGRAFVASRRD